MSDSMSSYNIEQLISSNFVKYSTLSELVKINFKNSTSDFLNIFIDLNSSLKVLYRDDIANCNQSQFEISASIINMCAHYRKFFSYMGVRTRFFLIYGDNYPKWTQDIFPKYNYKYIQDVSIKRKMANVISESLKYVNMITDYIPGVYFFDVGRAEVASMIVKIIEDLCIYKSGDQEVMLITKDTIPLQLISKYQQLKVLRPLKSNGIDNSFMINIHTLWISYFDKYRMRISHPNKLVPPELFSNILAMTRVPERSLYKIFSVQNAFKNINECLDKGLLKPRTLYMQSSINMALKNIGTMEKYNPVELENRWSVINPFFQYKYILPLEFSGNIILKDLDDQSSLKSLILSYYNKYPIMLDSLY